MRVTIDDCIKKLIAKEKCMERETSGTDTDCNSHNCDECSLCYEQGNMGEQKEALRFAVNIMRNYQMMQADYNARLKADMVAMLTELKEKIDNETFDMCDGFYIHGKEKWLVVEKDDIDRLIQEKIKALKEDT